MNPEDLLDMNASRGAGSRGTGLKQSAARRELACVTYNRGASVKAQRRIEVGISDRTRDGTTATEAQFRPFTDADSLMTVFVSIRSRVSRMSQRPSAF